MAILLSTAYMAAKGLYDTAGQLDKLDVSDVLAAILLKDTATLGKIKMEVTVKNIEHFWLEDALNPCVLYGSISVGAGATDGYFYCRGPISTTAGLAKVISGGHTVIRQDGYPTHIFKASCGLSTTISIAHYGSLTLSPGAFVSAANGLSTKWFILGNPYADELDFSGDVSIARTRRKNYTQIFERAIQITKTRENIDLYAVPDELKHQIKYRTLEIKRDLNNTVLNGVAYTNATAYTPSTGRHTMAGIIHQLRDPSLDGAMEDNTVVNAASGALTMTRINDLTKLIYDNGGFDDGSNCCIITSPYQARVIALLEEGRIRRASNELVVGSYANKVKTDLGFDLDVIIDRWCPSEILIVLDRSRVRLMPLQGDSWALEKMAKTGRQQAYQLSGQYTCELRNASEAHGMLINLAWS